MSNNLTTKEHWNHVYTNTEFNLPNKESIIYKWIKKHLSENNKPKTSFEVGIYPGGFSTIFGDFGYEINGIDRVTEVNKSMKKWLLENNYKVGDLICADFFTYNFKKKYDIVSSFGFIEHFKNFEDVIKKQSDLVKNNGYIIIETPNFSGIIQYLIKFFLDKKNLDVHYVPSMNFKKWERVLNKNSFKVIDKEYLGSFSLDFYPQKRNYLQRFCKKILLKKKYFLRKYIFKGSSSLFSPYMVLIAQKI